MCNGWAMARAKADEQHRKHEGEYLESLKEVKTVKASTPTGKASTARSRKLPRWYTNWRYR